MKKLLIATIILISITASSQSYQPNVTFTADEWGYVSAVYNGSDSIGRKFERKLRNAVQANLPITAWTQTITVDTVPNVVIIFIYNLWKEMPNGLNALYGNAVVTTINAMTNAEIVAGRNAINARYPERRTANRQIAKEENIDN